MNLPDENGWTRARSQLDERGFVLLPGVLAKKACEEIAGFYADDRHFRTRIEMARHSFGQGEYKYFAYPLPGIVEQLRSAIFQARPSVYTVSWFFL